MLPSGFRATPSDSLLLVRARDALASGPLEPVLLMERVCALPGAPPRVAARLAEALFARHADFGRDPEGRWMLVAGSAAPSAACEGSEDVPLRALRFAVVDVETTGTSPAIADRVTEIAIVQVAGGEVTDVYETLVNPERAIPPGIVALTQITWEMVKDAPRFADVASEVLGRLHERVFVAHNAAFDWRFVCAELVRARGCELSGDRLCTVRLARLLLPQLPRRSLDNVTHYLGVDIGARHRAAGDALATAHVLTRLLQVAEDRGATTWGALCRLLDGSRGGGRTRSRRRSAWPRGVSIDPTL